jgi:two-component system OmpR family response regulator
MDRVVHVKKASRQRLFAVDEPVGSTLPMARARLRQISATSRTDAGLRGRIEQFGLATVLSFLDLERRSGQILIVADDKMGRIWLRGGQAISARIEGSRRVNRAAIYELLSWDNGCFAFTQEDLPCAVDEIGAPTAQLLMNAALRTDEAAAPAY